MTVYIVYIGQYDQRYIGGVFLSKERAVAKIAELKATAKWSFERPEDEPVEIEVTE